MVSFKILSILFVINVYSSVKSLGAKPESGENRSHGRFRIIAGRMADITEFPYQASLQHYGHQWCGASIISRRVLISAAHCVQPISSYTGVPKQVMQARVGSTYASSGGKNIPIHHVIVHEDYDDEKSNENDISLIVLNKSLTYSEEIQPIELTSWEPEDGEMGWVTGYGRQEPMRRQAEEELPSGHLMAVELPIMDRDTCVAIHKKYGNVVTPKMICAGFSNDNKDSCKGDSGGPLAVDNKLVGIVAWGIGCGRYGIPGVYTNIAAYRSWIRRKLYEIRKEEDKKENSRRRQHRSSLKRTM